MKIECKLDWSYRGLEYLKIRKQLPRWLCNRMIYCLLDQMWDAFPKRVKEDSYKILISEEATDKAIRSVLPSAMVTNYLLYKGNTVITPWSMEDGNYELNEATIIKIRSVRLALFRYGSFTCQATYLVTRFLDSVIVFVRDILFCHRRNKDWILKELRDDSILDSLFWNMPLESTFWKAFSPVEGERSRLISKHILMSRSDYTSEQQQLLEVENHFRRLLLQDRGNKELADPFFHLVDVFANMNQFQRQPLNDHEKKIPALFSFNLQHATSKNEQSSICSPEEFLERWKGFTHNAFLDMDWNNVFAAGGAVLGALNVDGLNKYKASDIDLFLYGLNEEQAVSKLIYICKALFKERATLISSKNSVTFVREYPHRHIQIILRLYKSPAEVLLGFDIDCCSVGFDGRNVYCAPRCLRSLNKCYNLINMSRRSTSYEYRLFKYSKRGFAVLVPSLDGSKIDTGIYEKRAFQLSGLAKLLAFDYDRRYEVNLSPNKLVRKVPNYFHAPYDEYDKESLSNIDNSSDYAMDIPYGPNWSLRNQDALVSRFNWKMWHQKKVEKYIKSLDLFHEKTHSISAMEVFCAELSWMKENPGQQTHEGLLMTGSFQPLDEDTWETEAYKSSD